MRILFLAVMLISTFTARAQEPSASTTPAKKHQFFIYWGWNRAWYTHSDINFHGDNYNFTIKDVAALDRQTNIALDPYLNPVMVTIPQTNLRIGYSLTDHWSITAGVDHMKYVMVQNQTVKIDGFISGTETAYNKIYNDEDIMLSKDFLMFEHTDGLNYINSEARRHDKIYSVHYKNKNIIDFSVLEGAGAGILFPRTNTTLLDQERYDEFHVAGYGFSTVAGINILFWRHFFLQSELKGGFINMPDIRTTRNSSDRAKENFFFAQFNYLFGLQFELNKKKM